MTTTENAPCKSCPGCGAKFNPGGRGLGKNFCSEACRTSFQSRMKAEGAPVAALVKAWNATRHAKPGTREAEICRFARSELTAIAGHFNDRDEELGRPSAVDYVESLMRSGRIWADRIKM